MREMETLVASLRQVADRQRAGFFQPDTSSVSEYEASTAHYRRELRGMLGWPLTEQIERPSAPAETIPVGEDVLGTITRLWVPTLPGVSSYGVLFLPKGPGPFPLMLCQHGGGGTPELCSGLWGDTFNYNDMVSRARRRGFAAFAPQLQIWGKEFEPDNQRELYNRSLVQVGGSIVSLEIFRLMRCIDYLVTIPQIDGSRIGMMGLSYGGFYTLFTAAIDTRIKAALASCFVNDRYTYNWHDWVWFGSAKRFLDAEVAQLICPRPLWIEAGRNDPIFTPVGATAQAARIAETYASLGIAGRFHYREFDGVHELDTDESGFDFLCAAVRGEV
jgi:dienelactone hydrolase